MATIKGVVFMQNKRLDGLVPAKNTLNTTVQSKIHTYSDNILC